MDEILNRFVAETPVAVMVQATLRRVFADTALDRLFARHAQVQYTRELTFSTPTRLMLQGVMQERRSLHDAYRHAEQDLPVSVTSVYNKVNSLEPGVSQALVAETAAAMTALVAALPGWKPTRLAGLRLRTLDGNFLAGTDRRLECLRGSGAAALPGMTLVVRDGQTGLLTDVIPCEDAYTNERSLSAEVLALVRADDLWLADRNFCTLDYLGGIDQKKAFFLIRHHAGTKLHPVGKRVPCGANDSGKIYEQKVRIGWLECRCILVELNEPLRDGSTQLIVLTNAPGQRLSAKRSLELYRTRWKIETAFQELTDNLRCEITTLGHPKAALFGFALAVAAYNTLVVTRLALAVGQGETAAARQQAEAELSSYYLANEVAATTQGLLIAVPEASWQRLVGLSLEQFAGWLAGVAKGANHRRYRKSPRGPKKPTAVKRTQRGAHRSTARLLKEKGHG